MYIYNLDKIVSASDLRDKICYPHTAKKNPKSSIFFFMFEHNLPRELRRSDYFIVHYLCEVDNTQNEISAAMSAIDNARYDRINDLAPQFGHMGFDFSYDFKRMGHISSNCRPERYEDAVKNWIDYYKNTVGLNVCEILGPCVVHYDADGEIIDRQSE